MTLVIAENPSVGAAIAALLGATEKRSGYFEGGGYLVSWCIGHLISLAEMCIRDRQVAFNHRAPGCKPKDLIGIPWLVALALRGDGWYLRLSLIHI